MMGYPTNRVLGLTWVGWLNFLLLQWVGLRLCGVFDGGSAAWVGWSYYWPVLPLSGWWTDYVPATAVRRRVLQVLRLALRMRWWPGGMHRRTWSQSWRAARAAVGSGYRWTPARDARSRHP